MSRAISILIGALGGQGGGVLAEWLVDAAARAGFPAQATSIPGVAQRTGATTYYVEIYPQRIAGLAGRAPVLGLYPVPGSVDLLIVSELLEAARMVQAGMVSPGETLLIASTSRTLTTTEKMALGDGRVESAKLVEVARGQSRALVTFDMDAAARDARTVVSAVMAGAIAGSGALPFAADVVEASIRASGASAQSSLAGFARGLAAVGDALASSLGTQESSAIQADVLPSFPRKRESSVVPEKTPGARVRGDDKHFPSEVNDIVELGTARLVQFQDDAYAALYLRRLQRILAAERAIDPDATRDYALTRETARFLALWMAFDDIVRVAALKCRASRFARVRREVGARPGDIVRIIDYFKPGVPEIAGLLPAALAKTFIAWDRRRQGRGKPPLAWPLRLRADGVGGFLALRMLAGLKSLRRRGARYTEEQALIERWLGAIESAARADWQTAHEIALCGRLIKGYGTTNERGKNNLMHILDHLVGGLAFETASQRSEAIRAAREAALADEAGKALDATLVTLGAPPRPSVVKPIALVRRTQARAGAHAR
jgi:indolepyruvate ferredoxin oxidoreductase, beta subunit